MHKNKQAFTLIELLVVVLIIGILAAVALPQYKKAVLKAHITEAVNILQAISRAQEAYFLANGEYTNNIAELDILPPNEKIDVTRTGNKDKPNQYYYTCINQGSCQANAYNPDLPVIEFVFQHSQHQRHIDSQLEGSIWCHSNHSGKTDVAASLCNTLGTLQIIDGLPNNYYRLN